MPELKFEVFCARCKDGLCNQTTVKHETEAHVEPCEGCLREEYARGQDSRDDEVAALADEVAELCEQLAAAREKEK